MEMHVAIGSSAWLVCWFAVVEVWEEVGGKRVAGNSATASVHSRACRLHPRTRQRLDFLILDMEPFESHQLQHKHLEWRAASDSE